METATPPTFPDLKTLGPREKMAAYFAWCLFAICALLTTALAVYWFQHSPPRLDLAHVPGDHELLLREYRTQFEIVYDQVGKFFDLVVAKAFLPIFATIIGFLLGKKHAD